ncbi:50S ribosomal protein L23 [Mycoplasma sp. 4423]
MELTKVIKAPILSEKTDILRTKNNIYVFKVDYAANKYQIKEAIETIFQVEVESVNTIKVNKKAKNVGRYHGFTNRYKKAMVTLKDGQTMNYLPNESELKADDNSQQKVEEKAAKAKKSADVEAKVAQKLAAKKNSSN